MSPRSLLLGLGLALAALLMTAVVLEIGLRILPEEIRGYRVAASRFVRATEFTRDRTANQLGFHDVEHLPGPSDKRRVLLLGDSYVEAVSMTIPDTVGQRLEAELTSRSGIEYEVISMGHGNLGQDAQYRWLKKSGEVYEPAIVVTLFMTLNDLIDDSRALKRHRAVNDRGLFRRRPGWINLGFDQAPALWFENSELNRFISFRLSLVSSLNRKSDEEGLMIPFTYYVFGKDYDEGWEQAWELKRTILEKTRDVAIGNGSRYLVVSASTPQGVYGRDGGLEILQGVYPDMRELEWDLDKPDRRLSEICGDLGVPILLLEPLFRETLEATGKRLHWKFDGHWNADGNRLAASLIADFILEDEPDSEPAPAGP